METRKTMNNGWGKKLAAVFGCMAVLAAAAEAEAKRFGGARSLGVQRQALPPKPAPTPPQATRTAPTNPAPATAAPGTSAGTSAAAPASTAAAAQSVGATAAKSGMSRWMGPIAGLAAGLGLAALLAHLGLSETFASVLLLALLGFGAFVVLRWLLRAATGASRPEYAAAAATAGASTTRSPSRARAGASATAPQWSESLSAPTRIEPTFSAPFAPRPESFDAAAFLTHAKANFNALQAAHDSGDLATIRNVTTPEMYAEIFNDVRSRERHRATEVLRLDAELVEVKTEGTVHWASVRFSGLLREDGAELALPFEEIWNLTKPLDGSSGWLLAGIEQI